MNSPPHKGCEEVIEQLFRDQQKRWSHLIEFADKQRDEVHANNVPSTNNGD